MIVVRLIGGLGNQMFQYAVGRALSFRLGKELKLDISGFKEYKLREYKLSCFNINASIATQNEINQTIPAQSKSLKAIIRKLIKNYNSLGVEYLKEPYFHFWNQIIKYTGNAYLDGYWQSYKYFLEVDSEIRRDFTLIQELEGKAAEILCDIKRKNCISIHVRRGDYISDAITSSVLGFCGVDYYRKSIDILKNYVEWDNIYLFSDDIKWAKENLLQDNRVIYIDGINDIETFWLMKNCNHNIIANSSFSWWTAWLNDSENKTVIAPKKWFKDKNKITKDLFPESWITI